MSSPPPERLLHVQTVGHKVNHTVTPDVFVHKGEVRALPEMQRAEVQADQLREACVQSLKLDSLPLAENNSPVPPGSHPQGAHHSLLLLRCPCGFGSPPTSQVLPALASSWGEVGSVLPGPDLGGH